MPHVPIRLSEVLRQALKDTRSVTRVIPYSEWVQRLGDLYTGDPSSSLQIVASDLGDKSFDDDNDEDDHIDGQMASSKHVVCCDVAVGESTCMNSQDNLSSTAVGEYTCVSHQVHEASTALKVSVPEGDYTRVTGELASFGVPETKSRTNLGACRSQLFGLYTRRGVGITSVTKSRTQVLHLLHELAKTRESPTPYLAIAFNELRDVGIQEHVDANNDGCSDLTAFGTFEGGLLCQLGEEIVVKNQWLRFFGQLPHSVSPT
eukprot:6463959-Amphidinium_carterae.1